MNATKEKEAEKEATAHNIGWSYGLTMSESEVEAMIRGLLIGRDGQKKLDRPLKHEVTPCH